ncbi:CDP-alcohol phosphatidyltransferase family protein [Biformimicrobium ophioploci]|uniref:CDP-diacylglycerol--glycerol-3-phosphate 3-phosphatidyltransferase n=1 Tax=Biformimicrobium ophioploci TaxID=3036711 RepID=A0ABQ6LUU3_9GAMM|nr:CDP-alcohol phosphatidyltransferase family protein [Microbulbifer sp. NKW57]GMG85821.1 hypothetical protein MNKW57_01420 [Microbulbifer sp. NKW57]
MSEQNSYQRWRWIPNALTILRILLLPVIFWLHQQGQHMAAVVTFVIAGFSDFFDGRLARHFNWKTQLGAVLDPVADKLLVLFLLPLVWDQAVLLPWLGVLIFLRYLVQLSVFPVLMMWLKRPFKVKPIFPSKLATAVAFAIIALGLLGSFEVLRPVLRWLLEPLAFLGILLEIYVLVTFLPRYWAIIQGRHDTFE